MKGVMNMRCKTVSKFLAILVVISAASPALAQTDRYDSYHRSYEQKPALQRTLKPAACFFGETCAANGNTRNSAPDDWSARMILG
jgi:hypothetical protein